MSVERRRVQADAWTQWESQVVNGVYPLRRFLGGSNHSAVFLTEYKAENLADAAIKFVPADTLQAQAQLVQWGTAATLSHPRLVRLFDVGRCRFAGREFLFVVMEYADQTLAQVLPRRALSPEEASELLIPTLDALAFLHRNSLVHGHLKPSNFLVVNDQLKLASDTVSSAGKFTIGTARTALYDAPELQDGPRSTAGDVWDLGITLVEALTQRPPIWVDERAETALLPVSLQPPFLDIVRRCLSRPAANRPTVMQLQAHYRPVPWDPVIAAPQPSESEAPREGASELQSRVGRVLIPALSAMAAVFVIAVGVWVSFHLIQKRRPTIRAFASSDSQEYLQHELAPEMTTAPDTAAAVPAAEPLPVSAPAPAAATPAPTAPAPSLLASAPADSNAVIHEELPEVDRPIIDKIHGHVRVAVRVLVDPAGNVVGEFMESAGPSRYFSRLAGEAAGKWKFVPTDAGGARVWLLRFEFTRDGTVVDATTR